MKFFMKKYKKDNFILEYRRKFINNNLSGNFDISRVTHFE